MQRLKNHLLVIDPQNDFCDLPESSLLAAASGAPPNRPALPVAGAHADMQRLARWVLAAGERLSDITVTLDSHQHLDIGHPTFWVLRDGSTPAPFTPVRAADVRAGALRPRREDAAPRVLAYLRALEASGRYTHMIWPIHCEIGSWGHNVHDDLRRAYNQWEEATLGVVRKVVKGTNPFTEHYSAIQAEVVDPEDESTGTNQALLRALLEADRVFIAGEAGSHCVKATTEHIAQAFPKAARANLYLLSDCMSPVAGFEAEQREFFDAMRALGVHVLPSSEALSLLDGRELKAERS